MRVQITQLPSRSQQRCCLGEVTGDRSQQLILRRQRRREQPIFIAQGTVDTTVPLPLALALLAEFTTGGTNYELRTFPPTTSASSPPDSTRRSNFSSESSLPQRPEFHWCELDQKRCAFAVVRN